jgi:hypothetical protein
MLLAEAMEDDPWAGFKKSWWSREAVNGEGHGDGYYERSSNLPTGLQEHPLFFF